MTAGSIALAVALLLAVGGGWAEPALRRWHHWAFRQWVGWGLRTRPPLVTPAPSRAPATDPAFSREVSSAE